MLEILPGDLAASRAVFIMLEEAEMEYTIAPSTSDRPRIRCIRSAPTKLIEGVAGILEHLAEHSGRFVAPGGAGAWFNNLDSALKGNLGAEELLSLLEAKLCANTYLAAAAVSILDFAAYPIVAQTASDDRHTSFEKRPGLADWYNRMALRPALGRGMQALG